VADLEDQPTFRSRTWNQIAHGTLTANAPNEDFAMASIQFQASNPVTSAQAQLSPAHLSQAHLSQALGEAVVRLWGLLPPDVQHLVFEEATSHTAENRSRLAVFLHDKHPRTGASLKASAMIEPDSLGG
jgi:hypothetical protein